jgi:alpha-L-rhamnosidase
MQLTNLRCEYFVNPLGIAVERPRLSWEILSDRRGVRQAGYRIRVARDAGALAAGGSDLWDSGRVESDQSIQVEYGGPPLRSRQRAWWALEVWGGNDSAASGAPAFWEAGLLEPRDWTAQWVGSALVGGPRTGVPCPYLRRECELSAGNAVRSARLYVTALGIYEFFINGRRVGDDVFRPGWTDYRHRLVYDAYDVTSLLRPGRNALGAILADGWYCGRLAHLDRQQYGDRPRLLAQLVIEYENGAVETIPTDASWKTSTGPILEAHLLLGETYDARRELPGWDAPGFGDADWHPVERFAAPEARLAARRGPPVRATQELTPAAPIACDALPDAQRGYLFDLGENMVGTVRLRLRGPRGLTVRLRYGERLDADGSLYTANLRSARATDYYTLRGGGEEEVYQPRFTFHGFQYVEVGAAVEKWDAVPEITGIVLHSDTPLTGEFECSDPLINQLQRNIQRSQRGNFLEVPTDCPQRDERLGWTGDAQVFVATAAFNMDVAAFFTKWQEDLADSQQANGSIPPLVPHCCLGPDGGPAWADAVIICPWTIYQVYGDARLLREHYAQFVRFMDYLIETSPGRLRCSEDSPESHCFGDWLAIDGSPTALGATSKGLIGTAFFAYGARLLSRIAEVLGNHEDAGKYGRLFAEIRSAFQRRYFGDGGGLTVAPTQTSWVLALHFDLLPEAEREAAIGALVADIEARGMHLSTGFVGSPYLPHVLTRAGRLDVMFRLLHQQMWPSWLYAVTQGATSIWERWDGWTEEKGFQTTDMNSFNHYAYGAIGEWLYGDVAGIEAAEPGYKRIVIRPHAGDLTSARASYHSMHGRIVSDWRREGGRFSLRIEIPPNTAATVYVPVTKGAEVLEGAGPAAEAAGVKLVRSGADSAIFEVGSGAYHFSTAAPSLAQLP